MADILIDNQTAPSTPAAGKSVIWVDSTTKKVVQTDDGGVRHGILSRNGSTAAQGLLATTEVYLTGSGLLVPSFGLDLGTTMVWYISVVKTAAGVAAPVWTFRVGPNQTTADTSRLALTSTGAQVATAMDGILVAMLHVRTAGASGVVAGSGGAGPANFGGGGTGASSAFDITSTIAGQFVGLTVTTGASAAWTVNAVSAVMFN
jgi:hypothetical protein